MRVPVSWLRELVPMELETDRLADRLTHLGLEVEGIDRPGREVAGVVVGRLVSVRPHESAGSLRVCRVDAGSREVQVVTGAPNARAGAWVVVALPGATLPGGVEVVPRTFQGVQSDGMLCATWELGLPTTARTDEERLAEGILLLPEGDDMLPGTDARPLLGLDDEVLELSLTPNYAVHCQSILGVAREVGALLGMRARLPALPDLPGPVPVDGPAEAERRSDGTGGAAELVSVEIQEPGLCPRYIARVIQLGSVGPSPLWLQRRLQLCGMRPINNVVDTTNYILLETGQPLHAFDLRRLDQGRIIVRRAHAGEILHTLDGVERRLDPADLVIADRSRAQAIAGVMGGADSEVALDTRMVVLEAALFQPETVFRTARRYGLRTEASARFDKGVDPEGVDIASRRAAYWITHLTGGTPSGGAVDIYPRPMEPRFIAMRPDRIRRLLVPAVPPPGTAVPDLSDQAMIDSLQRLGFQVERSFDGVAAAGGLTRQGEPFYRVKVPSYRRDVGGGGQSGPQQDDGRGAGNEAALRLAVGEADLAEEVGRLVGFDHLPALLPSGAVQVGGRSARDTTVLEVRRAMVAAGYSEAVTWSFAPRRYDILESTGNRDHRPVAIANPMSEDQGRLRTTLLGGLLDALAFNLHRRNDHVALFEVGTLYFDSGQQGELPEERTALGLVGTGHWRPDHWQKRPEPLDFFAVKGALEYLARRLGVDLTTVRASMPFLQPGRSAALKVGQRVLGWLGELHPDVAGCWDLPGGIVVAEIDLDGLLDCPRHTPRYVPPPRYPAVERDVAFIAPETVTAAEARTAIWDAAGVLLEDLTLFDLYAGDPVPPGQRSLAFRLRYRATDRTLTDGEVDGIHEGVRQALADGLKVTLR